MFKQLLTFAMAATLALEAPATAYAAGLQTQAVADSEENEPGEGITETPSSGEQSDSATEPEEGSENETGAPEDNDESESGAAEDNDGNESGTSEDGEGNGGSETNPSENGTENEDNSSEENDG